jgi:hypothetical protein
MQAPRIAVKLLKMRHFIDFGGLVAAAIARGDVGPTMVLGFL